MTWWSKFELYLKKLLLTYLPLKWVKALAALRYGRLVFMPSKPTYNEDGLATSHNCDFMQSELFSKSYDLGESTGSWHGAAIRWRAYVCCWAASRARTLEGDFVECGVHKGGLALTVMNYVGFRDLPKTFFLMDTFEGIVADQISAEEEILGASADRDSIFYGDCYEEVKSRFSSFSNVRIIRGQIPDILPLCEAPKVAYLSIDMNCAMPEIAAAEFFWDKLVAGAVVVLDDYGYSDRYLVQKEAFDKFAQKRGVEVLSLPTGQGILIKP